MFRVSACCGSNAFLHSASFSTTDEFCLHALCFAVLYDKQNITNGGQSTAAAVAVPGCSAASFSPNGSVLAVGTRDAGIVLLDIISDTATAIATVSACKLKKRCTLRGHCAAIAHLDWSVDGRYLRSDARDSQLLHWECSAPVPPPPAAKGLFSRIQTVLSGKNAHTTASSTSSSSNGTSGGFKPRAFPKAYLLRGVQWASNTVVFGWSLQGIWPQQQQPVQSTVAAAAVTSSGSSASAAATTTTLSSSMQVDVCTALGAVAVADESRTLRLMRVSTTDTIPL
jgi:WD40 repeat protein